MNRIIGSQAALRRLVVAAAALAMHGALQAASFDGLTALAQGAVLGQNVQSPVPGFELLLLQHGQPIYHQAFGDWQLGKLTNVDSVTKTLSGAVMMSVAESHAASFSLDSRLSEWLPAFAGADKAQITVRQAFSHTSGLSGGSPAGAGLGNPNITLQQAAALIGALPMPNAPPGSGFSYGGASMQAAGAVAERVTGKSFVSLLAERLTVPLGMTDTRFVFASDSNPLIGGGVASTATDVARLMDMLLNDGVQRSTGLQVLEAESVQEMLSLQTAGAELLASPTGNTRYGIGVWLDQLGQAAPAVDFIAAGARGSRSWVDKNAGLVFVFATDLTSFPNVELLSDMMHAEILRAVPEPGSALLLALGLLVLQRVRQTQGRGGRG